MRLDDDHVKEFIFFVYGLYEFIVLFFFFDLVLSFLLLLNALLLFFLNLFIFFHIEMIEVLPHNANPSFQIVLGVK